MGNRFFTSDLHLGHRLAATLRGFGTSVEGHDAAIVGGINRIVSKKDKLFILGDVALTRIGFEMMREINCQHISLVLGNHDLYKAKRYLEVVQNIHGAVQYKGYLLTHVPIHPNELCRFYGNVHGHIHKGGKTKNPTGRYFNVNIEFHNFRPVVFDAIADYFKPWEVFFKGETYITKEEN